MEIELPSSPLSLDRVRLMGILNTTPDSFYDHGRFRDADVAVDRALEMIDEGADIIDVGGEKAGPGQLVSEEEELQRVVPVIDAIRQRVNTPISVDTMKPSVARAAMSVGADIINSISGFDDPEMRRVAANTGAAMVVMHIQGKPRVENPNPHYSDVVSEVLDFLRERVDLCISDGVPPNRILIDPGPDFGKTTSQNIDLLRHLKQLASLPYPVVLAASRKKFIGDVLNLAVDDRLEGSLALLVWGIMNGAKVLRVHDVKASKRVCLMTEAVITCSVGADQPSVPTAAPSS